MKYTQVATIPRDEFVRERFKYEPGEHVTIVGPTGWGKTHLAYQLLGEVAHPKLQGIVMVMKPRDATTARWAKQSGFKRIRQWPPFRSKFLTVDPPGYLLWPRMTLDVDRDNAQMQIQFERALKESYARGKRIVFADEIAGLHEDLDLDSILRALWQRGRSMEAGLWAASQRPTHIPRLAYSQPTHVFLGNIADIQGRKRLAEIGGIFPTQLVIETIAKLEKYQWLYIRQDGVICVVDK